MSNPRKRLLVDVNGNMDTTAQADEELRKKYSRLIESDIFPFYEEPEPSENIAPVPSQSGQIQAWISTFAENEFEFPESILFDPMVRLSDITHSSPEINTQLNLNSQPVVIDEPPHTAPLYGSIYTESQSKIINLPISHQNPLSVDERQRFLASSSFTRHLNVNTLFRICTQSKPKVLTDGASIVNPIKVNSNKMAEVRSKIKGFVHRTFTKIDFENCWEHNKVFREFVKGMWLINYSTPIRIELTTYVRLFWRAIQNDIKQDIFDEMLNNEYRSLVFNYPDHGASRKTFRSCFQYILASEKTDLICDWFNGIENMEIKKLLHKDFVAYIQVNGYSANKKITVFVEALRSSPALHFREPSK